MTRRHLIDRSIELLRVVKRGVMEFIYPSSCIECGLMLRDGQGSLCKGCGELLCLIDPIQCCQSCFCSIESISQLCLKCHWKPNPWVGMAAACELKGPGKTILHHYKYGGKSYYSEAIGGLMLQQLLRMEWPEIDVIVPVPISKAHFFVRGYNQVKLLVDYLAEGLGVEVMEPLKRPSDEYSQAGLGKEERMKLTGESWRVDYKCNLEGKRVLLIDDVYTTGSTLRAAAGRLHELNPLEIYVLAAFRS